MHQTKFLILVVMGIILSPFYVWADEATSNAIATHINANWYYYKGDKTKLKPVTIKIILDGDGELQDAKITQSSNSQGFDMSLIRAIRKSMPLPIPPEQLDEYRDFNLTFEPTR